MKRPLAFLLSTLACLAVLSPAPSSRGQGSPVVSLFANTSSGPLILGSDGNFYAAAYNSILKIAPDGTFTTFGTFPAGLFATAALTEASGGNFYGVAAGGGTNGTGALFEVTPAGQFTLLYAFNALDGNRYNADGASPISALVQAADGNLYGTTHYGGLNGQGVIYRITPAGVFTPVHQFTYTDGAGPSGDLIPDADGSFYGTTSNGGANGTGTVFKVTTDGVLTTLYTFTATSGGGDDEPYVNYDGAYPAGLTLGKDGNFYGSASSGGAYGGGTAYRFTPSGVFTKFSDLTGPPFAGDSLLGSNKLSPIIEAANGDCYGTMYRNEFLDETTLFFRVTPDGAFTSLAYADQESDISFNLVAPLQGPDGSIYFTGSSVFRLRYQPVITSAGSASIYANFPFSYQITATDNATTFGADGLPTGLSVDPATGLISGTPTVTGYFYITLSASNGSVTGTGPLTLSITTAPPPPVVTAALNATGQAGVSFTYHITASNSPTSFGADGLPAGLTVDPATGLISGKPSAQGTYAVTLTASNVSGTGSASLTLTVLAAPPAPVITSSVAPVNMGVGNYFRYVITATNSPWSYGASGLPRNLTFDAPSGTISGVLATAGTFNVIVSATNIGGTTSAMLTVNVAPTPAPSITSSLAAISVSAGKNFRYVITATNSPSSYGASGLPDGVTVNTATGVISGVPTTAGTFNVTISASNAGGSTSAALPLTVNPAPAITSSATATATLGAPFTYQITANFAATKFGAEGLPAGIGSNATSLLSGTPRVTGVFQVRIYALDQSGATSAAQTLTLTVLDSPTTVAIATSGDGTAQAGGRKGKIIVSRTGDTSVPLTVSYKIKGSAQPGIDYKELPGSVTIPAGASQAKIKIKPIANPAATGPVAVKIKLRVTSAGGFTFAPHAVAKVLILPADN